MKSCKTCTTEVNNSKTYCAECSEGRRLAAIKKQTEERKSRTIAARKAEQTEGLPKWMTERGNVSDTSMRSHFG